jgi:VanZ family protein
MFQKILQLAAWGAVVTIGVLSLVPGQLRPHTGAPGYLEHVAAYFITAILLSLGYPRGSRIVIIASLSIYAASLEIAQLYISGRNASVLDWVAGSFGELMGVAVATFILRLWLRSPARQAARPC